MLSIALPAVDHASVEIRAALVLAMHRSEYRAEEKGTGSFVFCPDSLVVCYAN